MSMFDRFLSYEENRLPAAWHVLESPGHIEALREISNRLPVVIFKHSTRCGASHLAKHRLEDDWTFRPDELAFYYLDVIAHRSVSNAVAQEFAVTHQSPQLIVIRNGQALFHTSHHRVSAAELRRALAPSEPSGKGMVQTS